jgi:hypothetical protein
VVNGMRVLWGRAQADVRPIAARDFNRIVDQGLEDEDGILSRIDAL